MKHPPSGLGSGVQGLELLFRDLAVAKPLVKVEVGLRRDDAEMGSGLWARAQGWSSEGLGSRSMKDVLCQEGSAGVGASSLREPI
eukprot:CAMPEP_0184312632 /NCGR_PEP_ID=MMETSP1049-20130417/50930_1 /TAXON_ID=77928 /ORGANISM="Proteomonas sulcata, Strain CCMP704" /LENGTH=84 /DNA_ID=CAMNT_0026628909 /DNA_START=20 /DNA_END=274 /DNA_ORIENTATION=+